MVIGSWKILSSFTLAYIHLHTVIITSFNTSQLPKLKLTFLVSPGRIFNEYYKYNEHNSFNSQCSLFIDKNQKSLQPNDCLK